MAVPTTYKVGDHVFVESQPGLPFNIRKIEELNKTSGGNVSAKVACYYRKKDLSSSLLTLSEKNSKDLESEMRITLTDDERNLLNHRELFLSRQQDTIPANQIRGKCYVTLINETENLRNYLSKPDVFYYSLVYDPTNKTLVADKGEIRVGSAYQATVPLKVNTNTPEEEYRGKKFDEPAYIPNRVTNTELDSFLLMSKSVGTYARALDGTSNVNPSLNVNATSASRDTTHVRALEVLHKCRYDVSKGLQQLANCNNGGPMLCRDELELWTPSETQMFEEALEKYGKSFHDIHKEYFSWKSVASIVEYYYLYKTTERYLQTKKNKALENENKLKQVYIPPYKASAAQMKQLNGDHGSRPCESCKCLSSYQWYLWGPSQGGPEPGSRLCSACWSYWKKYGGTKNKITSAKFQRKIAGASNNNNLVGGAPNKSQQSGKNKLAFMLKTTKLTKASRYICKDLLNIKSYSRKPFRLINSTMIKMQCYTRMRENTTDKPLFQFRSRNMPKIAPIENKLRDLANERKNMDELRKAKKRPHPDTNGSVNGNGTTLLHRGANNHPKKRRLDTEANNFRFKSSEKIRQERKLLSSTFQRSLARKPTRNLPLLPHHAKCILQLAANQAVKSIPQQVPNNNDPIVIED